MKRNQSILPLDPHMDTQKLCGAYREYQSTLTKALEESKLKWCKVKELEGVDFRQDDVVFLDTFLDESIFLEFYGATNVMVLPY